MAVVKRFALVVSLCLVAVLVVGGPALAATKVNVSVSDVRSTSAQISWTETNDTCFKSYHLQYKRTTAAGWSDDVTINSSITTSYRTVGYTPEVTYNFRVVDEDCGGNLTASDPVTFTTTPSTAGAAVVAAGLGIFLYLIVLVVILAVIGFVIRVVKHAAARALVGAGKSKDIPTASLPGTTSSNIPTPSSSTGTSMYQGGQPSSPSTPMSGSTQAAVALPVKFCRSCGSELTSQFCKQCGNKNW